MRRATTACGLVLALVVPSLAVAGGEDRLQELHQEIQQLRTDYEQHLRLLEERLAEAERRPPAPARGAARGAANAFNPAISAILLGNYWGYSRNPDHYALPGFPLGGGAGLAPEGLGLDESELSLSANIDDRFFGALTLALEHGGDTSVAVEEGYVEALGLPAGLGLKLGRFFSEVGYLNTSHAHAWDFADEPLAYRAFLGGQYGDDGVQLRWLAPVALFLEVGGEVNHGASYPAAGHDLVGAYDLFVHLGGDLGVSHSWRVGLAHLRADAAGREAGQETTSISPSMFDGDTDLTVADLVWKWAPGGNATVHSLIVQAEVMRRAEDGTVAVDDGSRVSDYDGTQYGGYLQAVYQFLPGWRAGLRYDRLWADNDGSDAVVLADAGLLDDGRDPERVTVMADYSHSEFSRIRVQCARDDSGPTAGYQWTVQYLMSLGAHGAHRF
jgi:hypothetical protein